MKPMKNLINVPESDECYTPSGQIKYILSQIPEDVRTIWCPFDTAESNIVKDLKQAGYDVIHTHISEGFDFFNYQPIPTCYDCIVSNPPYRFKTQGDANNAPDAYKVEQSEVLGVVKRRIKYVVYPTLWFNDVYTGKETK